MFAIVQQQQQIVLTFVYNFISTALKKLGKSFFEYSLIILINGLRNYFI